MEYKRGSIVEILTLNEMMAISRPVKEFAYYDNYQFDDEYQSRYTLNELKQIAGKKLRVHDTAGLLAMYVLVNQQGVKYWIRPILIKRMVLEVKKFTLTTEEKRNRAEKARKEHNEKILRRLKK